MLIDKNSTLAQELIRVLLRDENIRIVCIDPRKEWIERLPIKNSRLTKIIPETWEELPKYAEKLNSNDYVLCMTKGHATDRPVLEQILKSGLKLRFVGVIGSKAKRSKIVRELKEAGIQESMTENFTCPIGILGSNGKTIGANVIPQIAISIAAQLFSIHAEVGE